MRERPLRWLKEVIYGRITPACAGKTKIALHTKACLEDHPRVCGKDVSEATDQDGEPGSPPRVRERPRHFPCIGYHRGITPACAGKTQHRWFGLELEWDHPRVCGKDL